MPYISVSIGKKISPEQKKVLELDHWGSRGSFR